ncbi:MAG: histidine kinase [Rhodoferax sp.]|nr:histidine kinase [Rhodoferax sp.]
METSNPPLASGNRFQRAYYRWAAPYYARMEPDLREQAEAMDRFLYSRKGLGAWIGWLCGLGGLTAGMVAGAGMPGVEAFGLSLFVWVSVTFGGLAAWLRPEAWLKLRSGRMVIFLIGAGLFAGALAGFSFGHWMTYGRLDWTLLAQRLTEKFSVLVPAVVLIGLGLVLVFWTLAQASHQITRRRLEHSQLRAERDASARSAAEAHLRLLQAQIQPHFVFNTLATLQHWVDKRDERAGPLLRELTGFLRRSTDMLGRSSVPLAQELQAVRHYLTILQVRLGDRLQFALDIDAALEQKALPPGLLLTLVENAVGHGLEPRIRGGELTIIAQKFANGWMLQVDDDGVGLQDNAVDGVGLSNVRQRLHHHFGTAAELSLSPRTEGGTRALVRIHDEEPA